MRFYEHHTDKVISHRAFWHRVFRHLGGVILLLLSALLLGIVGFMVTGHNKMDLMDSIVDSCMLLGGMGPVKCGNIDSTACRIFASLYALFCGLLFVTVMGMLAAPMIHRLLHLTLHTHNSAPEPTGVQPSEPPDHTP